MEEYLLSDSYLISEKIVFCNKTGCEGHSNLFLIKKKIFQKKNLFIMLIEKFKTNYFVSSKRK